MTGISDEEMRGSSSGNRSVGTLDDIVHQDFCLTCTSHERRAGR